MRLFDGIHLEQGFHLDDDQRDRGHLAVSLHRTERSSRARCQQAVRHDPERRAEGVHRARDLHLSASASDAHYHRYLRLRQQNVPEWNTISISGYHMREAGSTAVQEVAFTLANGITYVQAAIDAGLDVDKFAPRLSFFFNAHSDFLEEVAKFRAARRMWARIMRDRFSAKNPSR